MSVARQDGVGNRLDSALARFIEFTVLGNEAGWLVSLEAERNIPFPIRRTYYIFGTQPGVRRGKHAHRKLKQVLVCLAGRCRVLLDDATNKAEVELAESSRGLLVDPMVWHEMYEFSSDCVLLVVADDWYDERDYIRDYGVFLEAAGVPHPPIG
jgi:dTDP-4-dehydrorhamnose 3,5-epimerase-like enzyme